MSGDSSEYVMLEAPSLYRWLGPKQGKTMFSAASGKLTLTDRRLLFRSRGGGEGFDIAVSTVVRCELTGHPRNLTVFFVGSEAGEAAVTFGTQNLGMPMAEAWVEAIESARTARSSVPPPPMLSAPLTNDADVVPSPAPPSTGVDQVPATASAVLEEALREVIAQFGLRVVSRPDQLRGALSDTLGRSAGEHGAEVEAVVAASREGVAERIRQTGEATPAQVRDWFEELVAAGVSLRDAALATRSWADALGAAGTARVATEVSDDVLRAEHPDVSPPKPTGDTEREVRAEVTPPGADERTMMSVVDGGATLFTPAALSDPLLPSPSAADTPGSVPSSGDPHLAATGLPTGTPTMAPAAPRSLERSGVRAFWPTGVAVVAVVASVAVGIPLVASRTAAAAPPEFVPVELHDDGLYGRSDLAQFPLTLTELTGIVTAATDSSEPYAQSEGYELDFKATDPSCTMALFVDIPRDDGSTPVRGSYAYDKAVPWLYVDSIARWYPTTEDASAAIESMNPPDNCAALATDNQGTAFDAALTKTPPRLLDDGIQVHHIRVVADSSPEWAMDRYCYLDKNIVGCVFVSGTNTAAASSVYGVDLLTYLDRRMTSITAYREQEQ